MNLKIKSKQPLKKLASNSNGRKIILRDFYEFIYDRHLIWYKRNIKNLAFPWTEDEILRKNMFCNVYRELDKCTIHLLNYVINNASLTLEDKIFNILLYRRFNTPNFYDIFPVQTLENFNFKNLEKQMDKAKANGHKLFNSAYIICQRYYQSTYRKGDKHVQQLLIMKQLHKNFYDFYFPALQEGQSSIEELHKVLKEEIPMSGDFMCFQYCNDITYIPELKYCFDDLNDFVAMGPGSKPGIDLLFPGHKESHAELCKYLYIRQIDFFNELASNHNKNFYRIKYDSPYFKADKGNPAFISLSNIQNCLCEFRKYIMLQTNPKKRKRYYKGANNV